MALAGAFAGDPHRFLDLIAAGSGSFGAFVMAALKRDAGVHHGGHRSTVTGAAGLLDRVAPLCFLGAAVLPFGALVLQARALSTT
jgi:predicted CDP-diglyceride synthetase/phosphatidate cytidylyltransferase